MDVINVPPSLPGTPIWNPTDVTEGVTSMTPTEVNNLREFYDFLYETCCMAHYTTNNGNHFSSNDSSKYIDHDGGHRTTHHTSQFSTNNSSADVSVCGAHNGGQYSTHWTSDRTGNNGTQYAQHLEANETAKYATHKQQNKITVFGAHDSAAQSNAYVSDNASKCPSVDNYAVGTYNGDVRGSHFLNVDHSNESYHHPGAVAAVYGSHNSTYKYGLNSVDYWTHETCHNSEALITYNNGVTSCSSHYATQYQTNNTYDYTWQKHDNEMGGDRPY